MFDVMDCCVDTWGKEGKGRWRGPAVEIYVFAQSALACTGELSKSTIVANQIRQPAPH